MANGLQHSHSWEQPEDSVQEYGWPGESCTAGHQRHAQKGLHLYHHVHHIPALLNN